MSRSQCGRCRTDGHRAIEIADLVRQVAANRRELLPWRDVIVDLGRTIKNPWKTGPIEVHLRRLLDRLTSQDALSMRLHPDVTVEPPADDSRVRVARAQADSIAMMRAKKRVGSISGPPELLDLVEELYGDEPIENPERLMLPRQIADFRATAESAVETVTHLLAHGRNLVEQVERLVCDLYGLSPELTEAVVAHAVARAAHAPVDDE